MKFYVIDDMMENRELVKESLDKQYVPKWSDALDVDKALGDFEKCPLCGCAVSMRRWLEPRKMRLTNSRYPDRITTWIFEPMLVSERAKNCFEQEKLKGIREFIPVEVVARKQKYGNIELPRYFCAEIEYTELVKIDYSSTISTGTKSQNQCNLCNPTGMISREIQKLVLDTKSWGGEDIFKVYSLGTVVSQKFYDIIMQHGFTNFNLVSAESYTNSWGFLSREDNTLV